MPKIKNSVIKLLSSVLICIGLFLHLPAFVSYHYHEPHTFLFIFLGACTLIAGVVIASVFKRSDSLDFKFIILTIVLGWLLTVLIGALPYVLSGAVTGPVDALFESTSGFTTTGATILTDIESMPLSILFWRSITHWLGGIGIIIIIIAFLPSFGTQSMQLFLTEVSGGPINQKISPRVKKTALLLLAVYLSLTILQTIVLCFGGMGLYESLVHSLSTISTGGFSSRNASIGHYSSAFIQYTVIFFMFLSGINFIFYCRFILGDRAAFVKNKEFRLYSVLLVLLTLIVTFDIWGKVYHSFESALRAALFQVTSIMTTTGFITADFDLWPNVSRNLLFFVMFTGGCVGSTTGSIKMVRVYVLLKTVWIELLRVVHPSIVKNISVEGDRIPHVIVRRIIRFICIYILTFCIGSTVMSFFGLDMVSAMSSTTATLGNIGPGMGLVGASESYFFLPPLAKLFLSFLMLLGRLEIITVIITFTQFFWKS